MSLRHWDVCRLWEDGWKQRYYESKFNVGPDEIDFRHTVVSGIPSLAYSHISAANEFIL